MRDLYEPFARSGNPIFVLDFNQLEIAKYAANAFPGNAYFLYE